MCLQAQTQASCAMPIWAGAGGLDPACPTVVPPPSQGRYLPGRSDPTPGPLPPIQKHPCPVTLSHSMGQPGPILHVPRSSIAKPMHCYALA